MKAALDVREGSIVEVDRTHLPVALRLPLAQRRCAGKVTRLAEEAGWLYLAVNSTHAACVIEVAVPPLGQKHHGGRGPAVRVIRR